MVNHSLFSLLLLLPPLVALKLSFHFSLPFCSLVGFLSLWRTKIKLKKIPSFGSFFTQMAANSVTFSLKKSDRYKLKISVIAVSQSCVKLVYKHEICKERQAGRQAKRNSCKFGVDNNNKLYSRSFLKVISIWIIHKQFCCDAGVAMYFNIDVCVRPSIRLVRGSNFSIVHCHKGRLYQKSKKKSSFFCCPT